MELNTVIFDMDGLLIDSEPLWNDAADEILSKYGKRLTPAQYATTTGLRTREFLEYWFTHFKIPFGQAPAAEKEIIDRVIDLVRQKGQALPGVSYIFDFFIARDFRVGLATSSPPELINVIIDMLGIRSSLQAISSANDLAYGKPHPEVYFNCAGKLKVLPGQCICFEDSYNGMIAVKAAKMKCVVVPAAADYEKPAWAAADIKIPSLNDFNDQLLGRS